MKKSQGRERARDKKSEYKVRKFGNAIRLRKDF
jgi:hypothetical protein